MKRFATTFAAVMLCIFSAAAQTDSLAFASGDWTTDSTVPGIVLRQCHFADGELFASNQFISVMEVSPDHRIDVVSAPAETLWFTTSLAAEHQAVAAVNGSFFNMRYPFGGATYTRIDGDIDAFNQLKDGDPTRAFRANGAVATFNGRMYVLKADHTADWEHYIRAEDVLTGGPIMMVGGDDVEILKTSFNTDRHPRTAVGKKADGTIVFVVADGRTPQAAGVSMWELRQIMKWCGCEDALNLDGGGSSTMVLEGKIVNRPCDNGKFDEKGERKVANAVIIR